MTESELLDRYARFQDAEAFTLLVERYQRLIFATCRRRLHHATDVDDAVQETFLRMAKAAGSVKSNVGGWLHRCATNVSTDLNRRRQTRSQHESQVVPATSREQNELAELREHLDAALEKLDAAERELILQRFFVGRTQVEIAGEAGVAPSTISLRLNSAIDHLRDHLKAVGYGVAAAALVSGLEKETASAAVPAELSAKIARVGLSGVTAAAGGFSFGWALAIFLVCMTLVGAGVMHFWKATPPLSKPESNAIQPATPPVALTVDTSKTPASEPPKWLPAKAAPAITGLLTGQIIDRAGQPVVGAVVELVGPSGAQAKTDANGQYAFKAGNIDDGDYEVGVTAEGFQSIEYWTGVNPKVAISGLTPGVRNFVLDRGVVVSIFVSDSKGQPLINTSVQVNSTDSHSEKRFEQLNTDGEGNCRTTLAPSKTPYLIEAIHDGFAAAHQEVVFDSVDNPSEVELILEPGVTVVGTAICSDGKPAAGWGIAAVPCWSRANRFPEAATIDANGKFSLQHLMAGKYHLSIDRHHEQQLLGDFTLPPDANAPLRVDIPGPSPVGLFTISGKLHCDGPISDGMSVEVHGTGANSGFLKFSNAHYGGPWTDDEKKNGAPFSICDIPAGTYELDFECTDIGSVKVKNVTVPGDPISVNLKIIGKPHLTGVVLDPAVNPVTRFAIRVRKTEELGDGPNYDQDENWIQVDAADGHFDIELVCPGVYQAQAAAPGYAWAWSAEARVQNPGDIAETKIHLTTGGMLRGSVVDAAGHAITGAKVIPLSMTANISMSYPRGGFAGDAGSVLTDVQGHFTLSHLASGDESVKITHADFAPLIVSNLKIADNQTTDVPPTTIHTGGSIDGTVYDARGNVAANAVIDLQDDPYYHYDAKELAAHLLATATTDSVGHFHVDHLPIDQEIYVEKPYSGDAVREGVLRRTVRLVDGQTQAADMGGSTPVHGRLTISGKPAASVSLTFSIGDPNFGPTRVEARTDTDGKFTFFGPPPGDYTLSCSNDNAFNRELLLGDFKLTNPLHDIGDVNVDIGKLIIHVNPDDAANIHYIELERRNADDWFKRSIGSANVDPKLPAIWTCNVVPAEKLIISVTINGPGDRTFRVPLERTAGAAEMSFTLPKIPAATATFTVEAKPIINNMIPGVTLVSEDGQNQVVLSTDPSSPREVPVPPGNYYIADNQTNRPTKDRPLIKAVAGQKTAVNLNGPSPAK